MLTRFLIYGLIGWATEVLWTGMGSLLRGDRKLQGWTYLWMYPIYGLAVLLEPIHNLIRPWPLIYRGTVYMVLIFTIEYLSGWFLKSTIQVCPWDYSETRYSVKGFIRLDYAPVWFLAGLLFEKLHDVLQEIRI